MIPFTTCWFSAILDLYFGGHLNVIATLNTLRKSYNMNAATDILVTGNSAGGIAVNHHADFFTAHFPTAHVVASPQAGWFVTTAVTYANFSMGTPIPTGGDNFVAWDVYFDESCVAATAHLGNPVYCFSMTYVYPYITTPVFVAQNRWDEYQLLVAGGVTLTPTTVPELEYYQFFGQQQLADMQQMKGVSKDGLFLISCVNHTMNINLQSSLVRGYNYVEVLGDWHFQRNQFPHFLYETCGSLPCNLGCADLTFPAGSGLTTYEPDPFGVASSVVPTLFLALLPLLLLCAESAGL